MNLFVGISRTVNSNNEAKCITYDGNAIFEFCINQRCFNTHASSKRIINIYSSDKPRKMVYTDESGFWLEESSPKSIDFQSSQFEVCLKKYHYIEDNGDHFISGYARGAKFSDPKKFVVFNFMTGEGLEYKENPKYLFHSLLNGNYVAFQDVRDGIEFRDNVEKVLWPLHSSKQVTTNAQNSPVEYYDCLIAYLGGDIEYADNGSNFTINNEIVSLAKLDGSENWKIIIPERLTDINLVKDKIYIGCTDRFYVVCAQSGDILYTQMIVDAFNQALNDSNGAGHSLCYGDDDYVYFFRKWPSSLLVYSQSSQSLVRKVDMPIDDAELMVKNNQTPKTINGKHYFELSSGSHIAGYFLVKAVLEVDPKNIEAKLTCDLDTAPEFKRSSVDDKDGHAYYYDVSHHSVDDIIRFGKYIINSDLAGQCRNEFQRVNGVKPNEFNYPTDENFTGKVCLRVEESVLHKREHTNEMLDSMVEEMTTTLKKGLYPEKGKHLSFEWTFI